MNENEQIVLPKGCKFLVEMTNTGMELVAGKFPNKQGQLWKGKTTKGEEMEMAFGNCGLVPYWGWS